GWWKNGYPDYFGKVINAMNFIGISIKVNNKEVDLNKVDFSDFYLGLDMRNGLLARSFIYNDETVDLKFEFKRFFSIVQKELCFIQLNIEVLKGEADISIASYLDGNVTNEDSNYENSFWLENAKGNYGDKAFLTTKTISNPFDIPQFTITGMMTNQINQSIKPISYQSDSYVAEQFDFKISLKENFCLLKTVAVATSRDMAVSEQSEYCSQLLDKVKKKSFKDHLIDQNDAWAKRWEKSDVLIVGDDEAQQGIRYNLFQLFSTYYGEDDRLNIGPKGFTGEKYGGATYWDTEAYAVPLYLALSDTKVTENLLMYRYNQLEGAKLNAKRQGLKGALYPMVTFTGVECHNEWEITFEEIHRNGAMVYAIYNYTNYTGDESYLRNYGIEVMVEISRFWADRVHFSKSKMKYMIHGVTGPNEYENNVNNNWYTNKLAAWVLQYTLSSLEKYPEKVKEYGINSDEQRYWQEIVESMYYPYSDELNVFVQHDTFLDKDLMNVSDLHPSNLPLNQHWSWDKILRSCFIKQADVLQGMYFFGNEFSQEEKENNFDFYEPMTVHESSLSPSIHAIIAAELKKEEKAVEMYQRTARLDLDNYNNDTEDGLHITSMTGSWLAIVQGFAGMRTFDGLEFTPFLPEKWSKYSFRVNYRERLIEVTISKNQTDIEIIEGEELAIKVNGTTRMIKPN
nr:glycoside hydrolase family 65 protein [Lactobacillus sp.]